MGIIDFAYSSLKTLIVIINFSLTTADHNFITIHRVLENLSQYKVVCLCLFICVYVHII